MRNKTKAKKRKVKELHQMSYIEKRCFLSNDLIERMIRVEQKVSSHFGQQLAYDKTTYYQGLTKDEKKNFDRYLKNKTKKRVLLFITLTIPIFLLVILKKFTSMAIETSVNVGNLSLSPVKMIILFAIIIVLFMVAIDIIFIRAKNRRFKKHFNVVDKVLTKQKGDSKVFK